MPEGRKTRWEILVPWASGILTALGALTFCGGVMWAWLGGKPLSGGRGAGILLLAWPLLGLAAFFSGLGAEWFFGLKVRKPFKLEGVDTVGAVVVLVLGLLMAVGFLAALVSAILGS